MLTSDLLNCQKKFVNDQTAVQITGFKIIFYNDKLLSREHNSVFHFSKRNL